MHSCGSLVLEARIFHQQNNSHLTRFKRNKVQKKTTIKCLSPPLAVNQKQINSEVQGFAIHLTKSKTIQDQKLVKNWHLLISRSILQPIFFRLSRIYLESVFSLILTKTFDFKKVGYMDTEGSAVGFEVISVT